MITPVILCGGTGTRLWPLSRKSFPKQFARLISERSLFQDAALRVNPANYNDLIVVTAGDYRFMVAEQLDAIDLTPSAILIEPESRNTAPAVLSAALSAIKQDKEATLLVMPSDHNISDVALFNEAIQFAMEAAAKGDIVTFGITPSHAETSYGYLELSKKSDAGKAFEAIPLKSFVEKPDQKTAEKLLEKGNYLWNAGIFLFKASAIIKAFETHAPAILKSVSKAVDTAKPDLDFMRLDPDAWAELEDISIDYAIMEKIDNLVVVPFKGRWNDLGSWDAVLRENDGSGDADNVTAIDCDSCLIRSESPDTHVVGLGLKDIMVVATPDAVLVADLNQAQEVKKVVSTLRKKNVYQADSSRKDFRPWGHFETLALGERFQVKRIEVKPGGSLSLQSHHHRSEHWIVVKGTAKVTVDEKVQLLTEDQSVYIPLGAVHRMENPGKIPMQLVEVQTGSYVGEDDIVRYEDIYSRGDV